MAEYTGSFSGSFEGNGQSITNIDYYSLSNLPKTITTFEENSILANNALRNNFTKNVKDRLDAEGVVTSSAQIDLVSTTNYISGVKDRLDAEGVVTSSAQIDLVSTTNYISGVKGRLDAEGVVTSSAQIDYVSIQNQPTTITPSQADAIVVNSDKVGFTDELVKSKLDTEGVISGSSQITITESQISDLTHTVIPDGTISGSSQVDYTSIENKPTTITGGQASAIVTNTSKVGFTDELVKSKLDTEGVISGSSQITVTESQISDLQTYLTSVPVGTVSSSAQITVTESQISDLQSYLTSVPNGTVSSSAQITVTESQISDLQSYLTSVPNGTVSSSAQIAADISGSITELSASIGTRFEGLTTNYNELDNIPNNIISSSAQIAGLGYSTSDSDSQSLSFNSVSKVLSISNGNTADLSSLSGGGGGGGSSIWATGSSYYNVSADLQITGSLGISGIPNVSSSIAQAIAGNVLPNGTISGSTQITITESQISDLTHTVIPDGTISGSSQITITESQISDLTHTVIPEGTISSSAQITVTESQISDLQSYLTSVPNGTVSSSAQITVTESQISDLQTYLTSVPSGTVSSSAQIAGLGYLTSETDSQTLSISGNDLTISNGNSITLPSGGTADYTELTNVPSGIVSGSVLRTLDGTGILSGSHTVIPDGTISGSSQITVTESQISDLQSYLTSVPVGTISSSAQIAGLGYLTSETDSQTLSIDGNDLTISNGNSITLPSTSLPSGVISGSSQITITESQISDLTHTVIPDGTISGSSQITITESQISDLTHTVIPDGTISGSSQITSVVTDTYISSSAAASGFGSSAVTSFNGNRVISNTEFGDLYSNSYNAGTSGSLAEFINEVFFPKVAPVGTFTEVTSKLNTNLATNGTTLINVSISDTIDDSPYGLAISGADSNKLTAVPQNAASSSWQINTTEDLSAGVYNYVVVVTDVTEASTTYNRTLTIAQATAGTLSTTGTLYIIESAASGPIYLGTNGRSGAQGNVSVSYSPNYGSQLSENLTSSNPLISVAANGNLNVGTSISGSGNVAGSTITSTIGWNDQYGNNSTSDITVNVTQNDAPNITFSNSSRLNTNQAVSGGGTLVTISFSDTEGDTVNHNTFTFTDASGQLTATKSGNNYLVSADNDLSGSTNYTISSTVEDTHGFRTNTESHTFNIVQHTNGVLVGDTDMYIIESAETGNSFRDATGFGAGNIADVNVTYSPSAGGQSVSSFSSSNPAILINSAGNLSLGVNISGSVTQSGATIQSLITFQDQYGNVGSGPVTASVFANNTPSVTFVSSSNYDSDNAISGSSAAVISISDTETNTPYNVVLAGTHSDKFLVIPQNAVSSSWQIQPTGSLSAATYSININVTDNYGKSSTLTNKSIVVDQASDYGTIYVYTSTLGSDAGFQSNYLGVMGAAGVNSDTPPEVTSFTGNQLSPFYTLKTGSLGDSSITLAGSTAMTLRDTISGLSTLDSALDNNGAILSSGTSQIILIYPSGSDMEVPTSIQQSINSVVGGGVPYLNVDSAGWGINSAQLHSITLDTAHLGYTEWFVLGRGTRDGVGTSFEYRIVNSNGGSVPS